MAAAPWHWLRRCRPIRRHGDAGSAASAAHSQTNDGDRPLILASIRDASGHRFKAGFANCRRTRTANPLPGPGVAAGFAGHSFKQRLELLFAQHRDAQLAGLVQLAAGLFAGDDVVGVLRDARGGAAAELGDQLLDLVAAVFRERAGDDERLAGDCRRPRGAARAAPSSSRPGCSRSSIVPRPNSLCRKSCTLSAMTGPISLHLGQFLDARPPAARPSSESARPAPWPRACRRGESTAR